MRQFLYTLKSDGLKLKRTPFFLIHIGIPCLVILIFGIYMNISPYTTQGFTGAYFQVISLAFPLVIALLTSLVSEQEIEAGGGMWLLCMPSRSCTLLSKLTYLLLFGLIACELAACGFGIVAPLVRSDFDTSLSQLIIAGIILWASVIFQYAFFLLTSLKFSRMITLGSAIFFILIGALFLTGLGDSLWIFAPPAWGARIMSLYFNASIEGQLTAFSTPPFIILIVLFATLAMLILLVVWFSRWEGRKIEE